MKWTNPGHQLDYLGKRYLKVKNLYIYGVDEIAEKTYKMLKWLGIDDEFNISFALDITVINQGSCRTFCGRPVISFQTKLCDAVRKAPEKCVIALANSMQTNEQRALEKLGAYNIFYMIHSHNRRDNFIQNFICVWLMYKHGKLLSHWTNFVTTSKCNLNCKHCLNFNEYITCRKDVTFEEFKSHIDTVFSKFDYLYSLHLTGGESQLVKDLPRFISYLQEKYSNRIFEFFVITNGTIMPTEEVLAALKSMNGFLLLDDYSDSVSNTKIEEIKDTCDRQGIGYSVNKPNFWFDLDLENVNYSDYTEEELEQRKDNCHTFLHEFAGGKIYACCYEEYANRAGIGTPDPADCIDIARTSKMEILEFRQGYTYKGYVNLCKYCRGLGADAKKTAVAIQIPPVIGKMSLEKQCSINEKALVSICVPLYNTGKYLNRCIKSLLAQTYRHLEIVLVDDGSTDQSGLICDEYAALDSRIIVVHKSNGGEASARNAGLRAANGEYVMFIDSDDEYLPNAVQLLVDDITKNGADLVVGGYIERTGEIEHFATGHMRAYTTCEIARACLNEECSYGIGYINSTVNAKLFKNIIIKENNISFDERFLIGNDSAFMCEYLKCAKTIRDIFAPIYVYYKYNPNERIQGMNWYYPDSFFLFAYVADRMIQLAQLNEFELKEFTIKWYKYFFYAAVNAAANIEMLQDGFLPYFTSICNEITFLQAGAKLDLLENYIAKEEGALPFRLISYLIINKRYAELCELLQALSKKRKIVPFQGERSRQMIRVDDKCGTMDELSSVCKSESCIADQFNFAEDKLLIEQIDEMAVAVSDAESRANEAEIRANEAEAKINEYINSTSWRITKPCRKLMQFLRNKNIYRKS